MEPLLAVLVGAVMLISCGRFVLGRLHDRAHPRDVAGWHVAMGAVMALMLVGSLRGVAAWLTVAAFAVGVVWSVVRLREVAGAGFGRLTVGCVAMVVMTLPLLGGSAAAAPSSMGAMTMAGPTGGTAALVVPTMVTVALLAAVVGTAGLDVMRLRTDSGPAARLSGGCDLVMALAMGYLLATML